MFLSLLKNIAECFMKAIKGLSFSSANEHPPYVNRRNFPPQQRLLSEVLRAFLSLSCLRFGLVQSRHTAAMLSRCWSGQKEVRRCSVTSAGKWDVEAGKASRILSKMQTFPLKCQRRLVQCDQNANAHDLRPVLFLLKESKKYKCGTVNRKGS